MTRRGMFLMAVLGLNVASCGSGAANEAENALATRAVTLPDGFEVNAEVKTAPAEMARGMMYRDSLAAGHGMLFVHGSSGLSPYWMANCRIPLDIVWIDSKHRVVEISAGAPPCPSGGAECPTYGGHETSQYVLEVGSGEAMRHGVRVGTSLAF